MEHKTILQRKLASAAPPRGDAVAKGWTTAFGRAARDLIGLDLALPPPQDRRLSQAEILEVLPERALFLLLEGPAHEVGLIAIGSDLAAAILECQVIGRLSPHRAALRRPTRTDAAMTAPLADLALSYFDQSLEEAVALRGYHYASFLDEPRALGLLLEDRPYRQFHCQVRIGATERVAELALILPDPPVVTATAPPSDPQWQSHLTSAVLQAEVSLQAIVARLSLPLAVVRGLAVGAVLPLKGANLGAIQLQAQDGRIVSTARLGQMNGTRMLKISAGAMPKPTPQPTSFEEQPLSLRSA